MTKLIRQLTIVFLLIIAMSLNSACNSVIDDLDYSPDYTDPRDEDVIIEGKAVYDDEQLGSNRRPSAISIPNGNSELSSEEDFMLSLSRDFIVEFWQQEIQPNESIKNVFFDFKVPDIIIPNLMNEVTLVINQEYPEKYKLTRILNNNKEDFCSFDSAVLQVVIERIDSFKFHMRLTNTCNKESRNVNFLVSSEDAGKSWNYKVYTDSVN